MSNESWISSELPDLVKEEARAKNLSKKELEHLQEIYEAMQIDPGEAVGVISAQSIGEPGTQMSLAHSEKVLIKHKDNVRAMKIGEFIDAIIETQPIKKESKYEIYDVPKDAGIEVLSLNKKEMLEWKKVKAISRHENHEELLKLKLRSGRDISSTTSHSFVIRKENEIIPIAGKELKLGDRIPVIRALNFEKEINSINVSAFCERAKHKLPEVLELTEQVGWIFGAYLAEGNATPYFVNISNNSGVFMQQVQNFSEDFGFSMNVFQHSRGFAESTDMRINSTALSNLLKGTCGTGSYNKKIPNFSINANKKFLSGLLRAYFDGDGNITLDRKAIRAYSKSKDLIDGISILLNRFGIFSRKSMNKGGWALTISHRYANIFLEEIGLDIPEKLDKLKELAEVSESDKQYNITEMYVGFSDILYQLAEKLGYPKRLINNFTKRQKIGRSTLKKYIKLFSELADKKKADVQSELEILKKMYNSDVVWDEIIGLEYVKDENKYLYDFSVDELDTFTTFNGIVTHNTMRTFHFVGVAELNVTLGLPRIIEILDAKKEPSTPAMNIALKSPHNKNRKAAEKIANKIKQTTLSELADEFIINLTEMHLQIKLEPKELKRHFVSQKEVSSALEKQFKTVKIKEKANNILISIKDPDVKKLYKLKSKLKKAFISGVKDVSDVLAVKRGEEFIIQTFGSNLNDVFAIPEVDESRTTSNNIHEVAKVLGIEAADQTIIDEAYNVLDEEGLNVDIRHLMLIADAMCRTGEIKGITRHGITKDKKSVLARASFEVPINHLIEASTIGEVDQLTSVVENIMINQPIPVGTGLPDLIVKMKPTASGLTPKAKEKVKAEKKPAKAKPKKPAKKVKK